jgi:hypothetical protein
MLLSALKKNQGLSDWAKWVRDDPRQAPRETREFLERCFANIAPSNGKQLIQRIGSDGKENIDAALHELVAHELFRRLQFKPEFQPNWFTPLTPDMVVKIGNQQFIVDVFVTHNPARTITPLPVKGLVDEGKFIYTVDRGDRAKKIWDTVLDKYHKYSQTGKPMILIVFLGDHWVGMHNVQAALYGASAEDAWLADHFPHAITDFRQKLASMHMEPPPGGAMLPDENGQPACPRLSAVLACDWFDTLNRSCPGKRLHCLVLHHWKPDFKIPTGRFGRFGEVSWSSNVSGCYDLEHTASQRTVARFDGPDDLEFRDYDASDPW